jgi:intein/homing endonuclease
LILTKEQDKYILKRMSEVKIGDIVLTIDPVENYKLKEIEVKKIHLHDEQEWEIMEIITESGKIRLTPNHPLIIDENNNNKKAGKLKVGDKILVYKEGKYNWEEIKEIRREVIVDKVMTLELKEEINTFLVSVDGNTFILAHSGYSHINIFKVLAPISIGGALLFLSIINNNLSSIVFAVKQSP